MNMNAAPITGNTPSPQLTGQALAQLARISLAAANGATISHADADFMARHFHLLVAECQFHRRTLPAMVHRIRTTCAQEGVDPAAFLDGVPAYAT